MAAILSGRVHPGIDLLRKQELDESVCMGVGWGGGGGRNVQAVFTPARSPGDELCGSPLAAFWHNWLTVVSDWAAVLLHS